MSCVRCDDTGWIEFTGGEHLTQGNGYDVPRRVEATPEKPLLKRCPCVYRKKSEPVREAAVYE